MAPSYAGYTTDIVDIRGDNLDNSLARDVYRGLEAKDGKEKSIPTLLLYNTEGLRLFEEITYLDEYYLTNAEIEVLETHAARIVERVPDNAQLVELGSGNLRKVEILLNEFERTKKAVKYLALDLSLEELRRTFAELPSKSYKYVKCAGLLGTYDDALDWLKDPNNRHNPTWILSMGSSIGNFTRPEAANFLKGFAQTLGPSDAMAIGLDSCKDPKKVYQAYNDSRGVTEQFYLNGLSNANSVLGVEAFKQGEWDVFGQYDVSEGGHKAHFSPLKDVSVNGIHIRKGEKVFFEQSLKYGNHECDELWQQAGLIPTAKFGDSSGEYYIHLLSSAHSRPSNLPVRAMEYSKSAVPSLEEFETLWKLWDVVTTAMVPRNELLSKPINLRNNLIFYLGHIPTFADIHVTRATNGVPTEPQSYASIFERGVDPDVDNPERCHNHSEIPDEWPPVDEILQFQHAVRGRVRSLLPRVKDTADRRLPEALWLGFEHEAMHLETFLYMLLQSDNALPPPYIAKPDFKHLALQSKRGSVPNEWFTIPEQTLSIGLTDVDSVKIPADSFGWDNEKPERTVKVHSFVAKARAITNGEYARYLETNVVVSTPASWVAHSDDGYKSNGHVKGETNGVGTNSNGHEDGTATTGFLSKYSVRTVFGLVPLEWAADWPVVASYDEIQRYAAWMDCRLPTFEELKSIYNYSSKLARGENNGKHRSNENGTNGVNKLEHRSGLESTEAELCPPRMPDHQPVQPPDIERQPVYIDLDECNVGFNHWHPTPVTQNGNRLSGQGDFGGVWEWTSSALKAHDGFKAMDLYPGYTADFFDGKHNIVLGGSWATHSRIAGRTTFVNWYQRKYPYVWAGARLVRDV